jgi:hypothetical protein|tara:strand:- start:1280 stop:1597 length:318 start_codon:yes stop_codon:yes gene_type:complete
MDINRLSEGVDYEFVPAATDDQAWQVRMLTGPFPETVVQFGQLRVDGTEESIHFDFSIIETPQSDLDISNEELQQCLGSVLFYILEDSLTKGDAEIKEVPMSVSQ